MKKNHPWTEESEIRYTRTVIDGAPEGHRVLLREFSAWLEQTRGNAFSTIKLRVRSARTFLKSLDKDAPILDALGDLDASQVEDFFVEICECAGLAARRTLQIGLRSFLRFARHRKYCADLVAAVPRLSVHRLVDMPSGLSQTELSGLLEIVARPTQSARTRALLYLLVTYGVRRGQVARLQLGDLDWRAQIITFAPYKGGRQVRHRLTGAVAKALAHYLRFERPPSSESAVFLRCTRPHLPLSPSAITAVVYSQTCQLGASRLIGPHALRHTFATRLLHAGQPMKAIADLLGHRSLASTCIYAKLDHPHLALVAGEWPGVQS